jgi:hypothetical protein
LTDEFNKFVEDPLATMNKLRGEDLAQGSVKLKEHIASERHGTDTKNQTFVTSDDEGIDLDPAELVGQLSSKQRKRLLKLVPTKLSFAIWWLSTET